MSRDDRLLIIGASGHGRVVADIALKMNRWQQIAFLDDNEQIGPWLGIQRIGRSDEARDYIAEYSLFVAIGRNRSREAIQGSLEEEGAAIPVLVHPGATIGSNVHIGAGTVVMGGTVINCNTTIGKGCIVNTGATVDHDNFIDDYVHISPGAHLAGSVRVGRRSWICIGGVVSNNVSVPSDCTVGAGAVVLHSIEEPGIYIGTPARKCMR